MKHKNTYKYLEPNRNFYTVWTRLPEEAKIFIHDYLSPIKDDLIWASTYSGELARRTPHITLRYLGYLDETDRDKIEKDISKFKEEVVDIHSFNIELGNIEIYTEYLEGKLSKARLSWEILNIKELREIHNKLLNVEGYDFFSNLEGENFHPHISLGNIDFNNPDNLERVKKYIESNKSGYKEYKINNIEINLCSEIIPLVRE